LAVFVAVYLFSKVKFTPKIRLMRTG